MAWQCQVICHAVRASTSHMNATAASYIWIAPDSDGVIKMLTLFAGPVPAGLGAPAKCGSLRLFRATADVFPSFLPKEVDRIKDPSARKLATRIERLPVQVKSVGMFGNGEIIALSFT